MIQAFHKMATAGKQIEVGTVRRYLHRNDDNSCWFGRWNYSLRWIQSSGSKTDKIVHHMEANAVDF
jgi:biopolymer transport protein ExbB